MKHRILLLSGPIFIFFFAFALANQSAVTKITGGGDTTQTDVLADALALNAPGAPKPPASFRAGHVTEGTAQTSSEKTEYGFSLYVGSSTQVPSPTIYNGKIYVGGGFGSKVFHCFDAKTGRKIWSNNLDDDGPSSAVIHNGNVIFNTESCTIFALDGNTGQKKWAWWMGDPLMSMPTVSENLVFSCYPAWPGQSSGDQDVQHQMNEKPVPATPVNSRLRATHVLVAFEGVSGKIVWQKWIDGDVLSAPVAVGDELHVVTFPGTVYKFSKRDGEILSAKASRATSAPVILADGSVAYTRRSDNGGEAREALVFTSVKNPGKEEVLNEKAAPYLDGEIQSASDLKFISGGLDAGNGFGGGAPSSAGASGAMANIGQSNVSSLQAFQGSRALVYNGNQYSLMGDELICVDQEGIALWAHKLNGDIQKAGGFLGTPPLAVNGRIIIATLDGDVVVTDAETGKELNRYKTGLSIRQQPVVDDGWIYASTTTGRIIAINTGDPKITGWAVWGADMGHTGVPVK